MDENDIKLTKEVQVAANNFVNEHEIYLDAVVELYYHFYESYEAHFG